MKKPVIVREEAEADLAEAYQWYEQQVRGLGGDFLLCVGSCDDANRKESSSLSCCSQRRYSACPHAAFSLEIRALNDDETVATMKMPKFDSLKPVRCSKCNHRVKQTVNNNVILDGSGKRYLLFCLYFVLDDHKKSNH